MSPRTPEKARAARLTIASAITGWARDIPAPRLDPHATRRTAGEALCRASNARTAAAFAAAHRPAEPAAHAVAAVLARRERFWSGLVGRSRGENRGYIWPDLP